jgi:hypothetical protein
MEEEDGIEGGSKDGQLWVEGEGLVSETVALFDVMR